MKIYKDEVLEIRNIYATMRKCKKIHISICMKLKKMFLYCLNKINKQKQGETYHIGDYILQCEKDILSLYLGKQSISNPSCDLDGLLTTLPNELMSFSSVCLNLSKHFEKKDITEIGRLIASTKAEISRKKKELLDLSKEEENKIKLISSLYKKELFLAIKNLSTSLRSGTLQKINSAIPSPLSETRNIIVSDGVYSYEVCSIDIAPFHFPVGYLFNIKTPSQHMIYLNDPYVDLTMKEKNIFPFLDCEEMEKYLKLINNN